ncbi:hypothetical protein GCM10025876_37640 [Demequina litorisediminis]|uniref:Uncharacterized protein n=1 Tax=Demequina litorisediminis TaxID=1849022 RepID=A0ABQ6IJT6_9MICO|nr:hypothetical protein GCM10025876_37640 [Demequina litorisediminis]
MRSFEGATEPPPALSKTQVGLLNTKLHVTRQDTARPISPLAWGAVCEPEPGIDWSEFGVADEATFVSEIVAKKVRIDLKNYAPGIAQIRIGAACDYAQKATGPIPYALAALLPVKDGDRTHELQPKSTGWLSPELDFGSGIVQALRGS